MSVDANHRRDVCKLLKEYFPTTQFVLTTHDPIWLQHMKTAGLLSRESCTHFRTWDVDYGPTEWRGRDVWQEIRDYLKNHDVRSSSALLRYYLEYQATELCHRLRAPVEFRGDAQFQLGDLLPSAMCRFRSLLKEGKAAAHSWGRSEEMERLQERESNFGVLVAATNLEQWQINPNVHYNEWANFTPHDFEPVVAAYEALLSSLVCRDCQGGYYVVPERGKIEGLRCSCGAEVMNLKKKTKQT